MDLGLRKILYWLFLVIIALPLLQFKVLYSYISEEPLHGSVAIPRDTTISCVGWFSGNFQDTKEKYFNQKFGFRSSFIRLNNQLQWSIFRNVSDHNIIVGKDNFINYVPYIEDYEGTDFTSNDFIKNEVYELKYIADTLEKLNKKLILVFAPNKADACNEFLPDSLRVIKGPTNYAVYVKFLRESGINFIDFNSYFKDEINKSPYPLFSPFSSHYSIYGAWKAGDSIISYIEKVTGKKLAHSVMDKIEVGPPKSGDIDLMELMNLMYPLPCKTMFAYPVSHVVAKDSFYKPDILIIGDSYFGLLGHYHFFDCISERSRWWQNNRIVRDKDKELETRIKDINPGKEIMKYDVVIIMTGLGRIKSLGQGFVDSTYAKLKH